MCILTLRKSQIQLSAVQNLRLCNALNSCILPKIRLFIHGLILLIYINSLACVQTFAAYKPAIRAKRCDKLQNKLETSLCMHPCNRTEKSAITIIGLQLLCFKTFQQKKLELHASLNTHKSRSLINQTFEIWSDNSTRVSKLFI